MSAFINTEQMERAACTFDNAVDHLQRVANQFESVVYQMNQVADRMERLSERFVAYDVELSVK